MNKGVQIFTLQGKVALISGAAGHLGSAMSQILAEAGAHILVNSRSQKRCEVAVGKLLAAGLSAETAVFDVTDQQAIARFFAGRRGALHILINNAYAGPTGNIELSKPEAYSNSFGAIVLAAQNLFVGALPSLRKSVKADGDASVINIASMYGMVSPDQSIYDSPDGANPPFYGVAKAALLQWTRYAACEFGAEGIRINSISPGPFSPESVQKNNPAFVTKLASKVPMGRIGQSDEIRGPALFLASPASSYVNGANIVVDGGWTCW